MNNDIIVKQAALSLSAHKQKGLSTLRDSEQSTRQSREGKILFKLTECEWENNCSDDDDDKTITATTWRYS